jgi:hypothetical protein
LPAGSGDLSACGLANARTRAAAPNFGRATDLKAASGRVIELSAAGGLEPAA